VTDFYLSQFYIVRRTVTNRWQAPK